MRIHTAVLAFFIVAGLSRAFAASPDADFLKQADMATHKDLQIAKIAEKNATHEDARKFTQNLMKDHSQLDTELHALAQKTNTPLPELKDDPAVNDMFKGKLGLEFDRAFANWAVEDHKNGIALFEGEAKNGQDVEVKAFAEKHLQGMRDHLKMAQDMSDKFGKSALAEPLDAEKAIDTSYKNEGIVEPSPETDYEKEYLEQESQAETNYEKESQAEQPAVKTESLAEPSAEKTESVAESYPAEETPVNVSYEPAREEVAGECCEEKVHCKTECDACHTCCEPSQDIVYDNDYRATTTELIDDDKCR